MMHMGKQTFLSLTVAVALGAAATGVVTMQTGDDPAPVDAPRTEEHEGRGQHAPRLAAGIVDALGMMPEEFGEQLRAGATPAEIAAGVGVDTATLSTALLANFSSHINDAVAEGRIDSDRAAAILEGAAERFEAFIAQGPGERHLRPAGSAGPQHGRRGHRLAVSAAIGVDPTVIRDGLQSGQSLADIATANGSSADAVIAAIMAQAQQRLDDAVATGRLRAEDATAKLADLAARIAERVHIAPPVTRV